MESNNIVSDIVDQVDPPDQPIDGSQTNLPLPVEVKSEDENIIVYISTGTALQKLIVKESECTDIIISHGSTAAVKYINREIVIDKRPRPYNIFGEPLPKVSHRFPVPRQGKNIVLSKIVTPSRRYPRYIPDVDGNFVKQIYDPFLIELSTEYEPATDEEPEDPEEMPEGDDQVVFSLSGTFYWVIIWWNDIVEFYTYICKWVWNKGVFLYRLYKDVEPEPDEDLTRGSRLTWT